MQSGDVRGILIPTLKGLNHFVSDSIIEPFQGSCFLGCFYSLRFTSLTQGYHCSTPSGFLVVYSQRS